MPDIVKSIYDIVPGSKETTKVEVKYYEGTNGVKLIYSEALKSKEIRSYVNMEKVIEHLPDNGDLFLEAQKKNKELKMWEIAEDSETSRKLRSEFSKTPNYNFKIAPESLSITAVDVLMFDDKVCIISLGEDSRISGTMIANEHYYNHMRAIFDFVWSTMK